MQPEALLKIMRQATFWRPVLAGILGLAVGMALALFWLALTPPQTTARMTVGPLSEYPRLDVGAFLGEKATPLRSLVEPLVQDRGAPFERFLSLLSAPETAARINENPDLKRALFPDEWDPETGRWHPPAGPGHALQHFLRRVQGVPAYQPPDEVRTAARIRKTLRIEAMAGSPLRRLSLQHREKAAALALIRTLHREADRVLRERAASQNAAALAHLRATLAVSENDAHRRALTALILDREQTATLIAAAPYYAAEILSGPSAPARPDWPPPLMIFVLAMLSGALAGVGIERAWKWQRG